MKRVLLMTLILSLLSVSLAESYPAAYVSEGGDIEFTLLLDDDGTALTPRSTYSSIYAITPEDTPPEDRLYAAATLYPDPTVSAPDIYGWQEDDLTRAALMNARGELLTDFEYSYFSYDENGDVVIAYVPGGRCGVLSRTVEALLPPVYSDIVANGEGGYLAIEASGNIAAYNGRMPIVCIAPDGTAQPTGWFGEIGSINQFRGGVGVLIWIKDLGPADSIFVDGQGRQLFNRSFYRIDGFQGDLAPVSVDEFSATALIDRGGRLVTPAIYDYVHTFGTDDDGVFVGTFADGFAIIDQTTGGILREEHLSNDSDYITCWDIGGRLLAVSVADETFIYDFDGRALSSWNGCSVSGWYGKTDATLNRVLLYSGDYPYYSYSLADLDGSILAEGFQDISDGIWSDGEGRLVFATERYLEDEDGSPYIDWSSRRYGLCDQDGSILLEATYDAMEVLGLDRFWVRRGSRCGMIDSAGSWLYAIDDYEYLMD